MGHGASRAPLNGSEPAPLRAAALGARNGTAAQMAWGGGNGSAAGPWGGAERGGEPGYRHFATAAQLVIFVGSLLGECRQRRVKFFLMFLWNLLCSNLNEGHFALTPCERLLKSTFSKIDCFFPPNRYYSVLYPLERKITDAKSRDLVIYIWAHAIVASIPVFAVTNVSDIYAMSTCSESWSYSLGHLIYVVIYNITTVIVPVAVVFLFMILIRRALSASQKKKVIIAALRTPQNTISIPYASQREAELHAMLLSMVVIFIFCSIPYVTLVIYRTILNVSDISVFLLLTAIWLPKVSLLANPLLFLTVNKSVRKCLVGMILQLHRRYSRRNIVSSGGVADANLEPSARSGSQLLEMFHIGQQQIFKPTEDEENETKSVGSSDFQQKEIPVTSSEVGETSIHKFIPQTIADSAAQVAPAVPAEADMGNDKYSMQFGFGPFELPPQWLSESRNSKKRLLPPLGNTPEELIQTKQPKCKAERKISRNNKVSIFPKVDS
uniref:G-protein coupled receptors family 1 profile domain-containing protein n=1 Tax=Pavo cristatus TaxID=9049 RepID=A0A8C9F6N5_PAVCR